MSISSDQINTQHAPHLSSYTLLTLLVPTASLSHLHNVTSFMDLNVGSPTSSPTLGRTEIASVTPSSQSVSNSQMKKQARETEPEQG